MDLIDCRFGLTVYNALSANAAIRAQNRAGGISSSHALKWKESSK
jgi:hypothetical protein